MPRLVCAAIVAVLLFQAGVAAWDDRWGFAAGFVVVAVGFVLAVREGTRER
jgi:hypothetical protein